VTNIAHKALVAKSIAKDVIRDVDGYYVWFPKRGFFGGFTSGDLEMIAKLLREANRLWDNEVKRFFGTDHPEKHVPQDGV
jgi:hypothetical protein